jgi:hypothetical protein
VYAVNVTVLAPVPAQLLRRLSEHNTTVRVIPRKGKNSVAEDSCGRDDEADAAGSAVAVTSAGHWNECTLVPVKPDVLGEVVSRYVLQPKLVLPSTGALEHFLAGSMSENGVSASPVPPTQELPNPPDTGTNEQYSSNTEADEHKYAVEGALEGETLPEVKGALVIMEEAEEQVVCTQQTQEQELEIKCSADGVCLESFTWTVFKRYSSLLTLHAQLTSLRVQPGCWGPELPSVPSKRPGCVVLAQHTADRAEGMNR